MTEFRQSHRSTTPKWSSSRVRGAILCCPHPVADGPCDGLQSGASQPTAIANTDPKPKPGRNREAAPRQSHQQYTTHGKPAASHHGSYDSPIPQRAQGRAGCWARGTKGRNGIGGLPVESGSPAGEDQATAARRGRRASSRGVAVGEVRR